MSGFSDRGVVGFTMLQTLVFPSCSHWGSGKGAERRRRGVVYHLNRNDNTVSNTDL